MKNFYCSTAIDYPSGPAHLGHAYEKICCDVIARWKRLQGFDVHFSTGVDCHGLKVQRAAEKAGKTPEQFVNEMTKSFRRLCEVLNISFTDFIMTTEERHKKVVYEILKKIYNKGDIYKGVYKGLYCVDCETYYTRKELIDGKCPVHKKEVEEIEEESYFFKMSKYQKRIVDYINKNPACIWPEKKRKEILNRLKEPLMDLSISREKVKWGIPLPFEKNLSCFVWVEALINYTTTIDYPHEMFKKFWPATHIIGSDIVWHHTAIWFSILNSIGVKLPRVVVHGFINIGGEKLSKAKGLVIDPFELVKKYSSDALRYFLLREIPFGEDGDFSEASLKTRNNDELADILGNLIHRILNFIYNKTGGKIPKPKKFDSLDKKLIEKIKAQPDKIAKLMENFKLKESLEEIIKLAKFGNEYFQAKEPWEGKNENCLYLCSNLTRCLAILIAPYLPSTSQKIWEFLNLKGSVHEQKWNSAKELLIKPGHKINKPKPLFKKVK